MTDGITFKAGDLVRLKSGGPLMTVESVGELAMTGEQAVWCVWSDKVGNKQVVQRDTFPPVVLESSQKPGGGIGVVGLTRR
jgi:uncharacterized protein YodC (DUF2158 family)